MGSGGRASDRSALTVWTREEGQWEGGGNCLQRLRTTKRDGGRSDGFLYASTTLLCWTYAVESPQILTFLSLIAGEEKYQGSCRGKYRVETVHHCIVHCRGTASCDPPLGAADPQPLPSRQKTSKYSQLIEHTTNIQERTVLNPT